MKPKTNNISEMLVDLAPRLKASLLATTSRYVTAGVSIDDVVQETCRRVVEKESTIRQADSGSLLAWMQRTARRLIIDQIRKKQNHQVNGSHASVICAELTKSGELTPSNEVSAGETARQIRQAMEGLSVEHQRVIQLRYVDQLGFEEIATLVGRSTGSVRGLHRTALAQLKNRLGRESTFF